MVLINPEDVNTNRMSRILEENCKKNISAILRVDAVRFLNHFVGNVTVQQNWEHIFYSIEDG